MFITPKKFICINCNKEKKTTQPEKIICNKCEAWREPGKGQLLLFNLKKCKSQNI